MQNDLSICRINKSQELGLLARFKKTDRGQFALKETVTPPHFPRPGHSAGVSLLHEWVLLIMGLRVTAMEGRLRKLRNPGHCLDCSHLSLICFRLDSPS